MTNEELEAIRQRSWNCLACNEDLVALLAEIERLQRESSDRAVRLSHATHQIEVEQGERFKYGRELKKADAELAALRAFRDRVAAVAREDVQYLEAALCDCGQYWGNNEERPRDATGKHADSCLWLAAQQKGIDR